MLFQVRDFENNQSPDIWTGKDIELTETEEQSVHSHPVDREEARGDYIRSNANQLKV